MLVKFLQQMDLRREIEIGDTGMVIGVTHFDGADLAPTRGFAHMSLPRKSGTPITYCIKK